MFPGKLDRVHRLQATAWNGVYELPWGGHRVRVIVLNQIVPHPRNAPWELFASKQDQIRQGLAHYRARTPDPHQRGFLPGLYTRLYRLLVAVVGIGKCREERP